MGAAALFIGLDHTKRDEALDDLGLEPILVRVARLPARLGMEQTDCGHGEGLAMALAQEMLPPYVAYVTVSDSKAIIGLCRSLQDAHIPTNRSFIQKLISGVGKGTAIRMLKNLAHVSKSALQYTQTSASFRPPSVLP